MPEPKHLYMVPNAGMSVTVVAVVVVRSSFKYETHDQFCDRLPPVEGS